MGSERDIARETLEERPESDIIMPLDFRPLEELIAAAETLDAIRLAVAGASDRITAHKVIVELLEDGPSIYPGGTTSVQRFLDAVDRANGKE